MSFQKNEKYHYYRTQFLSICQNPYVFFHTVSLVADSDIWNDHLVLWKLFKINIAFVVRSSTKPTIVFLWYHSWLYNHIIYYYCFLIILLYINYYEHQRIFNTCLKKCVLHACDTQIKFVLLYIFCSLFKIAYIYFHMNLWLYPNAKFNNS